MTHLLLVANETVEERELLEAVGRYGDSVHVTVVAPINQPRRGYVVYSDTRRASAHRRLDRALQKLRKAGIEAEGYIVDGDPAAAVRDAVAQLEPPVDTILVSTHPEAKSGWLRRNVVERIRSAADDEVLDRYVARGAPDPLDHVAAQPTGLRLGMGRDEDRVHGRLELSDRVSDGRCRVAVDDVALGLHAGLAQLLERAVEPAVRRRPARV